VVSSTADTDFKKSYDSVTREVLYIFTEFGVPMKLIRLLKTFLKETCGKVLMEKYFLMYFLFIMV